MAQVVVVTSGKGGVGKTTSTAALGAALARAGERVVVVDFGVGLRNLDLVMGAERRVVFDLIHVVQARRALASAHSRQANRHALPARRLADARQGLLSDEGVERVIRELRPSFDWVICDSPAESRGASLPCVTPTSPWWWPIGGVFGPRS
jgi:septum site-determining protein MinD